MPASGAEPERLRRYAGRADGLDGELRRVASRLPDPGLAAAVALLAEREAGTTRWVRSVGEAFRFADAAGDGSGSTWVTSAVADAYVTLASEGGDADVAASAVAALLASGASPATLAGAARTLGDAAIDRLARTRPDLVGPVDGMPLAARYAANRRLVRGAQRTEPDPSRRARLAALLEPDPATGRDRQLLLFDARGDGRAAEVFGDPATATALAVVVPGVGTDLDDFDRTLARPVAALRDRAEAGGASTVAAVAWLGYDPPDGLGRGVGPRDLGDLLSTGRARSGGRELTRLLAGLPAAPGQRRALVGHSYGSTTVAAALLAGAEPDHVVVLGSPGVLVDRAAGFGLPDTTFHVLAAPGDPVASLARLGWFGGDPAATSSGFTPLATGVTGHSRYLEPGSPAQANVAAVVAGTEVVPAGRRIDGVTG